MNHLAKINSQPDNSTFPATDTVRAFIAVELDEDTKRALVTVQRRLQERLPADAVRWVRLEGIHLTLKFLGEVPRLRIEQIAMALALAASSFAPFQFTVEGRGCFPNFRRPSVIWVAVNEASGQLAQLHTAIEAEMASLGYSPEERSFHPHLTLGRVRREIGSSRRQAVGAAVEAMTVTELGTVDVESIYLIRSELKPGGAVYTPLAEVPLGNTGRAS